MAHKAERHLLQQLLTLLSQALASRDWARIKRIDLLIRGCLQSQASAASLPEDVRALRHRLKQLHGQAMAASVEEGARLRGLLDLHLAQAEGISAYRTIDRYRSEE
jgi:hypothetical protein